MGAMATYVRAGLPEVATALAALTGEPHPLAIKDPGTGPAGELPALILARLAARTACTGPHPDPAPWPPWQIVPELTQSRWSAPRPVTQRGSLVVLFKRRARRSPIRHPGIIQRPVIRAALRPASRCANIHDTSMRACS